MARWLVPTVLGAALGASTVAFVLHVSRPVVPLPVDAAAGPPLEASAPAIPAPPGDAAALSAAIERAVAAERSLASDRTLADLYKTWAREDAEAALLALGNVREAATRREIALALLDVFGNDADGVARVARALPREEVVNFEVAAIVARAERDTRGAFAALRNLPAREQRRLALLQLAPVLAERDPYGAIAEVSGIKTPQVETEFMRALIEVWAAIDPDSVFAWIEGAGRDRLPVAETAFAELAGRDPERLLTIADRLLPDAATAARRRAFEAMIRRDPLGTLALIGELPPTPLRGTLERAAAELYGERDPDAAWMWIGEQQLPPEMRLAVLRGMQKVDPDRALELALAEAVSGEPQRRAEMRRGVTNLVYAVVNNGSSNDVAAALDRVRRAGDVMTEETVIGVVAAWAGRDFGAALDWAQRNPDRVSANLFSDMAATIARSDAAEARQVLFRLEEEQRAPWASGVAEVMAQTDLAGTRAWAEQLPRGAVRDAVLREYLTYQAHGGVVDRQLLRQIGDDAVRVATASAAALNLACDGHKALAVEIATTYIANADERRETRYWIDQFSSDTAIGFDNCRLANR